MCISSFFIIHECPPVSLFSGLNLCNGWCTFREALLDPHLSRYSVIIVDEAHERTVHTDVLLGLLKSVQDARSKSLNNLQNTKNKKTNNDIQLKENGAQGLNFLKQYQGRTPLKLIIMSASLDARIFSEYFGGARAVHIQGRQFPVDIFYTLHVENDYLDASLATIFQVFSALCQYLCQAKFFLQVASLFEFL